MVARLASFLVSLLVACPALLHAEDPVVESPVVAAQAVIAGQIKALMADDADNAYSYASPDIRSLYPDKRAFLTMVQRSYSPVYHAGAYAFGRSKLIGGGEMVLQEVMINGREGRDWTAIYEMRLMDDGSYKVNGVRMMPNSTSIGL